MDSRTVVEEFFARWSVQDVELTATLFHDDMVYRLDVVSDLLPFGGEWRGKDACREAMFSILEEFDYLRYDPTIMSVRGRVVRAQVHFKYQHRRTGGVLEGRRRLVFTVQKGLIVRVHGYHDAELVDAFMRLTHSRIVARQFVPFPELPRREKPGSAG